MWLKQFSWFDLQSPLLLEGEALEEALSHKKAYTPHATQTKSIGWESPISDGHPYAVNVQNYTWMVARLNQKLLPANVVNTLLKEKLAEIEKQQGYPVSNKQRRMQRDELVLELLPKAFVQSKLVNVIVDHDQQVLLMDQTSPAVKDMVVDLLKQTLGSIPMTHHLETKHQVGKMMGSWMSEAPYDVEIESEFSFVSPSNVHAKARMVGLDESLALMPLQNGMSISQLSLRYKDSVKFQLNDKLDISRIKYLNVEEAEKLEDPVEQAVTEFSLSIGYVGEIIKALKMWFPLEEKEEACDVVE